MILARFCDKVGKPAIAPGSSHVENYSGENGWFPVESFKFGFESSKDGDDKDKNKDPKAQQSSRSSPSPGGRKERKFAPCSITKQVDTVTALLMVLAMKERETKRGEDSKLEADIHILASVQISELVERHTFTNLMIHLESVNIQSWDISGSGDARPTETVGLKYDRGAMIYVRTPDARETKPLIGPKGWDSQNLKEFGPGSAFNWNESLWKDFLP